MPHQLNGISALNIYLDDKNLNIFENSNYFRNYTLNNIRIGNHNRILMTIENNRNRLNMSLVYNNLDLRVP